jgi:phosphatidylinositol-3,4,5-trisphosphate 3-phosphatase/dual-specificity protein phosphatase PTEN
MSFPGSGFRKLYRNSIDTVAKFLNEHHPGNYRMFNLAQHSFDSKKFGSCVAEFPWKDHHSPSIQLLIKACDEMLHWLLDDPRHVGVVN